MIKEWVSNYLVSKIYKKGIKIAVPVVFRIGGDTVTLDVEPGYITIQFKEQDEVVGRATKKHKDKNK